MISERELTEQHNGKCIDSVLKNIVGPLYIYNSNSSNQEVKHEI